MRDARRWSQQDLADELKALGHPIDRTKVARTETGARIVPLDDVLLFAAALGVCPLHLIVPVEDDENVELAPQMTVRADEARRWFRGQHILRPGVDDGTYLGEVPVQESLVMERYGLRSLLNSIEELVTSVPSAEDEHDIDRSLQALDMIDKKLGAIRSEFEYAKKFANSKKGSKR